MTVPSHIRELLDACRPDHDDWTAPEMAPLAKALASDAELRASREQCAQLDRAIRDAMTDVPVPEGLADRLLARLAAHVESPSANRLDSPPDDADRDSDSAPSPHADRTAHGIPTVTRPPPAPDARRRRRRWLVVSSLAAASLVAAGMGWLKLPVTRAPSSADELAASGILWSGQAKAATNWNSDLTKAPVDRAASTQIRGERSRWRKLPTPYDSHAVAYAIRGQTGEAWLFVLHAKVDFLQPEDRPQPLPATGGVTAAAWTEGPLLYVLVTSEPHQRISDFVAPRDLASVPRPTHVRAT